MPAEYDAFVSYSRGASQPLAIALQSAIERFATPWYRTRSSRLFRDDASMSANTALWSTIEAGLAGSTWYVLIATPEAAASPWVRKELQWWLQHRGTERMLIVRHRGELAWDAAAGDVDWAATTALDPVLAGAFAEEPRWVDLAWFEESGLGTDDPRWMERVADLAAAIRGVERDELIGENVRARRRGRTALVGGASALAALLVASLVATGIAIVQGNEARTQATIALARQLAAQSGALASGDIELASLLAVEAVRTHEDEHTLAALFAVATATPHLVRVDTAPADVTAVTGTADGSALVVGTVDGEVLVGPGAAAGEDGSLRSLGTIGGRVVGVAIDDSGSVVAASREGLAAVWIDGVQRVLPVAIGEAIAVSGSGDLIAVFGQGRVEVLARTEAGYRPTLRLPGGGPLLAFSADDELVTADGQGHWWRVPLGDPAAVLSGELFVPMSSQGMALSADGRLLLSSDATAVYPVVELAEGATLDDAPLRAAAPVSGPLALALSDSGAIAAVNVDDALYVVPVVAPTEPAPPTLVLDGGGAATPWVLDVLGERLVLSGSGPRVLVWDLGQSSRITTAVPAIVPEDCRACRPPWLVVSPDGTAAVAATDTANPVVRYDLATGAAEVLSAAGAVQTPAWLDATTLAAYSGERDAVLLLGEDGAVTASIPVGIAPAGALASSAAGGVVGLLTGEGEWVSATPGGGAPTRVRTEIADLLAGDVQPLWAQAAPDGATAAILVREFEGDLIGMIVSTADGAVLLRESVDAIAYRGDGDVVVVVDGVARVLDTATGELGGAAVTVSVDPQPVPFVSPDGGVLVNTGLDGRLELLDLTRWGALLGSIAYPDEENAWAFSAFTPDGARLVTAVQAMSANGGESSLRVTDLRPTVWAAAACAIAGRELTEAEWRRYLPGDPPADRGCLRGEVGS